MKLFNSWFDERFIMHRLKSTRFATVITAVVMGVYVEYEFIVHHVIRWEIMAFLGVLVITKLGAMLYYRLFN